MTSSASTSATTIVLRLCQGPEDFVPIAALAGAARTADGHLELNTPEMTRAHYESLPNTDLARDVALAFVADRPAGYVRTDWRDELAGGRVHNVLIFVDPATDLGLAGAELLAWAEGHVEEVARSQRGVAHSLAVHPFGVEPGFATRLESAGYRPVRHGFTMRRRSLEDVPDLPLPPGIDVRPARPDQLRAIFAADREAFRDHWAASEEDASEASYRQFLDDPTNDLSLWRIAWAGDQIVGQVRGYVNEPENAASGRRLGWCECISTRRPWRGQGVARALIAMTLREFRARGLTESALTVDAQNATGAVHLYELMGFEVAAHSVEWRRPLPVPAAPVPTATVEGDR